MAERLKPLNIFKSHRRILFLCILSSLLVYLPTYRYGIVTDFLSWLIKYNHGSLNDVWLCFGYSGLHQFFHLVNYTVFKIVGTSHLGWYLVLSTMHGINAFMVFRVMDRLQRRWMGNKNVTFMSLWIAGLFLFYPYNSEAVIWKACLHYLLVTFLMLAAMRWTLRYLEFSELADLIKIHIFFLLALFTLEVSFVLPVILSFLIFGDKFWQRKKQIAQPLLMIVVPQLLLLTGYFFLSKFIIGHFIGHYGAEKHLNFDLVLILANTWKYLAKHVVYTHYHPFWLKEVLYAIMEKWSIVLTLGAILLSLGILWACHGRKINMSRCLAFFMMCLFLISIAPVINLYFWWILPYENDRYGYFASPFIIASIVLLIGSVQSQSLRIALGLGFTLLNLSLFASMIKTAWEAGVTKDRLIQSFRWENHAGDIYILGIPDNYNGMYMFRDFTDDGIAFRESLDLFEGKNVQGTLIDVAQFNQMTLHDRIDADFTGDTTIDVKMAQGKTWFWRRGLGLTDYEKETFTVELKGWFYKLQMEEIPGDAVFIVPQAGIWKTVQPLSKQ